MSITVKNFGSTKPTPGAKPTRVQVNPKLPFGQKHPVNWWTGKHVPLHKAEEGVEIEYSTITHVLRYRTGPTADWITITTAVPETIVYVSG